jgi:hypothetical protein
VAENKFEIYTAELNPAINPEILDKTVVILIIPYSYQDGIVLEENLLWFTLDNATGLVSDLSGKEVGSEAEAYYTTIENYINTYGYTQFLYNYTSSDVLHLVSGEQIVFDDMEDSLYIHTFEVAPIPKTVDISNKSILISRKETKEEVISAGDYYIEDDKMYALPVLDYGEAAIDLILTCSYKFNPVNDNQYLIVSESRVEEYLEPSDLAIYDVRSYGGGIKEGKEALAAAQNEEVNWYWDIGFWDGKPVPLMGVERIDLPYFKRPIGEEDNLEDPVDWLNSELLTSYIQKREALGNYPIKYVWGPQPTITNYISTGKSLVIYFSDEDSGTDLVRYYIKYRKHSDKSTTEYSWSEDIDCDTTTHSVTINSLRNETEYEFVLWAQTTVDGEDWWKCQEGNTIIIKTQNEG